MKKSLLLLVTLGSIAAASAQTPSLRDALYGGKLKLDTNSVVRKGDDLSTKIDTSTRKPELVKANPAADSAFKPMTLDGAGRLVINSPALSGSTVSTTPASSSDGSGIATATPAADGSAADPATAAPVDATKDNNRVWKTFIDSLTSGLRSEVMTSKKIKSGTYSVLVEYEIGLEGEITVNSITSAPENSFLTQQVRDRIDMSAPKLTPLLSQYGKPRKAVKRQTLVLTK